MVLRRIAFANSIPLCLDFGDLAQQQLYNFNFAYHFGLEPRWQWPPVAGSQGIKAFSAILTQGLVIRDPLTDEQILRRLTCRTRSRSKMACSREVRRWSSSSGVGGDTIAQTRGSPRFQARSVRNNVSPSIVSVLARRRRLGTAIDAASTI